MAAALGYPQEPHTQRTHVQRAPSRLQRCRSRPVGHRLQRLPGGRPRRGGPGCRRALDLAVLHRPLLLHVRGRRGRSRTRTGSVSTPSSCSASSTEEGSADSGSRGCSPSIRTVRTPVTTTMTSGHGWAYLAGEQAGKSVLGISFSGGASGRPPSAWVPIRRCPGRAVPESPVPVRGVRRQLHRRCPDGRPGQVRRRSAASEAAPGPGEPGGGYLHRNLSYPPPACRSPVVGGEFRLRPTLTLPLVIGSYLAGRVVGLVYGTTIPGSERPMRGWPTAAPGRRCRRLSLHGGDRARRRAAALRQESVHCHIGEQGSGAGRPPWRRAQVSSRS